MVIIRVPRSSPTLRRSGGCYELVLCVSAFHGSRADLK